MDWQNKIAQNGRICMSEGYKILAQAWVLLKICLEIEIDGFYLENKTGKISFLCSNFLDTLQTWKTQNTSFPNLFAMYLLRFLFVPLKRQSFFFRSPYNKHEGISSLWRPLGFLLSHCSNLSRPHPKELRKCKTPNQKREIIENMMSQVSQGCGQKT